MALAQGAFETARLPSMLKLLPLFLRWPLMEKMTDFVFNFPIDEDTVDTIQTLRNIRLGLAHQMLASIPSTVDELVKRGLILESDRQTHMKSLRQELRLKIANLEKRTPDSASIYSDELELYLDLIKEPAQA